MILSVGTLNVCVEDLITHLRELDVRTLVDLRTQPESYSKQYRPSHFKTFLSEIRYVHIKTFMPEDENQNIITPKYLYEFLIQENGQAILEILKSMEQPIAFLSKESDIRKCRIRCAIADFLVGNDIDVQLLYFGEDLEWHLEDHQIFKEEYQLGAILPSEIPYYSESGNIHVRFYWAHHLRGRPKKETIQQLAENLCLFGFCVTGWPGIFAIQGSLDNLKKFHIVMSDQDRWKWRKLRIALEFSISEPIFTDWAFVDVDPDLIRDRKFQFGDVSAVMRILKDHNLDQFFDICLCLNHK